MPGGKPYPLAMREKAYRLLDGGLSIKETARKLLVSSTVVWQWENLRQWGSRKPPSPKEMARIMRERLRASSARNRWQVRNQTDNGEGV